ncbi:MAG: hypothetical protein C0490_28335 [Marivirga sp.]|nr:hypothetical protein [Marivirga sp.]
MWRIGGVMKYLTAENFKLYPLTIFFIGVAAVLNNHDLSADHLFSLKDPPPIMLEKNSDLIL